jgi:hypothetical protein
MPSPAIVVGVLALVAALAGTAVAGPGASTSKLTKRKVNELIDQRFPVATAGIGDNAVTTPKIADGAVTTPKIGDAAVTDGKVADDSLTGAKINESTLGSPLLRNVEIVADTSVSNSTDATKSIGVDCPAGKLLTGGGASVRVPFLGNAVDVAITDSGPSDGIFSGIDPGRWVATASEYNADPDPWSVRVYAVCADA